MNKLYYRASIPSSPIPFLPIWEIIQQPKERERAVRSRPHEKHSERPPLISPIWTTIQQCQQRIMRYHGQTHTAFFRIS
jgi:hypothetical protein